MPNSQEMGQGDANSATACIVHTERHIPIVDTPSYCTKHSQRSAGQRGRPSAAPRLRLLGSPGELLAVRPEMGEKEKKKLGLRN